MENENRTDPWWVLAHYGPWSGTVSGPFMSGRPVAEQAAAGLAGRDRVEYVRVVQSAKEPTFDKRPIE